MRVVNDKHSEVVRHFRTIDIEDGPEIDCGGTGEYENYFPGTLIRVDKIKLEWIGDAEPKTVEVSGPYTGKQHNGKTRYNRRYPMDALPGWLWNVIH
jgi:hypothetical protein